MDSIVRQLSEIELAAVRIVVGADAQKGQYDEEMKQKRKVFDDELSAKTAKEIAAIQVNLEKQMDEEVTKLQQNSDAAITAFEQEYANHHEEYAAQIIQHMTEV